MNKERRAAIDKSIGLLSDAKEELESARDEEQDYLDNMPENMQDGDKGQATESAISSLDDAINSIEEAMNSAEESKNQQ